MKILILGKPNVGKTSLYNLISKSDTNIIHETIGTTRDWHVSYLKNNSNLQIYDTPGIINFKNKNLDKEFLKILKDIDIFIYVIDYKKINYQNDKDFLNSIRKYNKEILLVINKDDNFNKNKNLIDLGIKNFYYVSCEHKLGISELLDYFSKYEEKEIILDNSSFSIGLFGKTNVGKSTLLNKLVGYERSVVSNKPKTTTDIVSSNFNFKGKNFIIKDTAGLIKKNKIDRGSLDYYVTKKTLSIIRKIDLNIFLIDINQGFDNQSKKIFNLIYSKSKIILFLINKIDLIKKNKKNLLNNLKKNIETEFSQSKNVFILHISSFDKHDISKLKNFIYKLSLNKNNKISTSRLNIWLKKVIEKNPHSRIRGKEVRFKYATQISDNPLTIKVFTNFSKEISTNYKRYLTNNLYDHFKIKSTKLKIIFSKSVNPFD